MFQSAPLTKARGDRRGRRRRIPSSPVSIRSPHQSKGRRFTNGKLYPTIEFQSAPLTKARGDRRCILGFRRLALFQSAPLTKARGDLSYARMASSFFLFQSAPLTKARGDRGWSLGRGPLGRVSIRSPHQSKGRLNSCVSVCRSRFVSIRSPHQSKGRRLVGLALPLSRQFQSAPLTKARGDSSLTDQAVTRPAFQSAPLTKARGDLVEQTAELNRKLVSIRSPHQSKGRRTILPIFTPSLSFQSAPLTKARGDWRLLRRIG